MTTVEPAVKWWRRGGLDPRWCDPVVAVLGVATVAGLVQATGLPGWLLLPVGAVAAWVGARHARRAHPTDQYGPSHGSHVARLAVAVGTVGAGWAWWAASTPRSTWLPVGAGPLAVLVVVGLLGAAAWTHLRAVAPRREAETAQVAEDERIADEAQYREDLATWWERVLTEGAAEMTGVKVQAVRETEAGVTLELVDRPTRPLRLSGLQGATKTLASVLAQRLAPQGVQLQERHVRAEGGGAAHLLLLHITMRDRFAGDLPFELTQPVSSILEKQVVAVYEDGTDCAVDLCGVHGSIIGATGSGKDVFTNNILARVTRTVDCLTVVGGSDKLMPAIWPWLAPYLRGLTDRPILEAVAGEDPYEVLWLLNDLLHIVKIRNSRLGPRSKHVPTPQDPAIYAVIVETSDLVLSNSTKKITCFDGNVRNGSELINDIEKSGRAACVSAFLASQFGLFDALGSHGSYIKRNTTFRVAGKTLTHSDGASTLVGIRGVDTTQLVDHTLMVQPSTDTPRAIPAKAFLLDGEEMIRPVVLRNTPHVSSGLPEYIVSQLQWWPTRWHPDRHPELVDVAESEGLTWRSPDGSTPSPDTLERETVNPTQTVPGQREGDTMSAEDELQQGREQMEAVRSRMASNASLTDELADISAAVSAGDTPAFLDARTLVTVMKWAPDEADMPDALADLDTAMGDLNLTAEDHEGQRGYRRDDVRARLVALLQAGQTASPAAPPSQPVPPDTRRVLDALPLQMPGEWLPSNHALGALSQHLGWPVSTEGARRLADVLRAVGVESSRPTINGQKTTAYPLDALRRVAGNG